MIKLTNALLIITSVFLGFGFVAKQVHLPGGSISLVVGSLFSLFGFLFYLVSRFRDKESVKPLKYAVVFYLFTMSIGTAFLIERNPFVLESYLVLDRQLTSDLIQAKQIIATKKLSEELVKLNKQTVGLVALIESYKVNLIRASGGVDLLGHPVGLTNLNVASDLFYNNDWKGEKLRLLLIKHQNQCVFLSGKEYLNTTSYAEQPSPEYAVIVSWEGVLVDHQQLHSVLLHLSLIQSKIMKMNLDVINHLE